MVRRVPRRKSPFGIALALAVAFAGAPALAAPRIHVLHKDTVQLEVSSVTASAVAGKPRKGSIELDDRIDSGELKLELAWPSPTDITSVTLTATRGLSSVRDRERVELEAEVRLPDGTVARSRREVVFDDSTTSLFEIYRSGGRPLTLAVAVERVREEVLSARPAPGRPIQFLLEVQRVEGGETYTLESNRLSTFAGEPVSYFFRFGQPPDVQTARVSLSPVEIRGELARVEIEVSGMLPSENGPSVVGRKDEWVLSRGATSTLALETGTPPTGYRFRVTPRF